MKELVALPYLDNLQTALGMLSQLIGNKTTVDGIVQGLPLPEGKLASVYLGDAAQRAGLAMRQVDVAKAKQIHCPILIFSQDGRCLIIHAIRLDGIGIALDPEGAEVQILLGDIRHKLELQCWSVSPLANGDVRAAGYDVGKQRHWILEALWFDRHILGSIVAATVSINILALAIPLITMNVLDRVVSHAAFETLWALAIGGIIAVIGDFALRSLRGILIDKASAKSDVQVLNRIFARVLGARLKGTHNAVGIQANTLREFESLREISNSATMAALGDLPFAILFLFVIHAVAGPLVWVPVGIVPLLLIAGALTQRGLQALAIQQHKDNAHKNAVAVEMLSNIETIKVHVAESWAATKWEKAVAAHLRHSLDSRWQTALGTNYILALQGITTIAILVVGVYLIAAGDISAGALYATSMLAGRALMPVAQIAMLAAKFYHARSAYSSIRHMVDAEQERPDDRHFIACPKNFSQLSLDQIGLSYGESLPLALNNVSFQIRKGERIGIIGGIGAGKSSLLRVLLGLNLPTSGTITLDGVPVQQFEPSSYRKLFGTALRESGFFFGTIRDNLAFHQPQASDADIVEAARKACALDWIKGLPKGFDTQIGEGGANLSGGQRQTLALARSFLANPEIFLLDEPTSDLDTRTEGQLVLNLRNLPSDKTLLVITHRPAIINVCTRLIVMERGGILMDGDAQLVLARLSQIMRVERKPEVVS